MVVKTRKNNTPNKHIKRLSKLEKPILLANILTVVKTVVKTRKTNTPSKHIKWLSKLEKPILLANILNGCQN